MEILAIPVIIITIIAAVIPVLVLVALIKLVFGGGNRRRRMEEAEAKARVLERAWRVMDEMERRVDKLEVMLLERRRAAKAKR